MKGEKNNLVIIEATCSIYNTNNSRLEVKVNQMIFIVSELFSGT